MGAINQNQQQQQAYTQTVRRNPMTGQLIDEKGRPIKQETNPGYIFGASATVQQLNQQRQAALAARQKAEKRVTELEKELQGFRDIAEGKNVGFKTPLRTVSTAGSMGGNLRIGNGGATSRRAVRARARGVSQLSTS